MSDEKKSDLEFVQELTDFLQGTVPEGCVIEPEHIPKLTREQADTVIWWLGNQYRSVSDHIERCGVCGDLYDTWSEGETMDFSPVPYFFCGNCHEGEEAQRKRRIGRGLERAQKRQRHCRAASV